MVSAQQVTIEAQQAELVPYQQAPSSVTTQGFFDTVSAIGTMIPLFIMVMIMSMMRGFIERPEVVRKIAGEAITYIPKVGPAIAKVVKGE